MSVDTVIILRSIGSLVQKKSARILILGFVYSLIVVSAIWISYQLRFDFFVEPVPSHLDYEKGIIVVAAWILPIKLLCLFVFGQFSGLMGYFGTPDLLRVGKAVGVSTAMIGIVRIQSTGALIPPRGVILIDFVLFFVFFTGFRMLCRLVREFLADREGRDSSNEALRIGIFGAGDVGASLAKELLIKRGLGRVPVAFFDDDITKSGTRIHNVPVVGKPETLMEAKGKLQIDEVVIAMPTAVARRIGELVRILQRAHTKFVTVPSLDQMATGKVRLSQFREIEIQDLLGRESVVLEKESIAQLVADKVVLVTGAGGSIGRELCRQVCAFNPSRLLMVDQSECLLFEIEQELVNNGYGGLVRPLVGNILDERRIENILSVYRPDIMFHAAAVKHVPMMELQPSEAIKVNSVGTATLARMAMKWKVRRFVMISTDKAINPTSVMGASKRLAEIYIQSLFATQGEQETLFMAVRFGNVLGSSGSVVPTFRRQIESGGPVRVTHPDVTRYFMTIPEAVGLVLQCGSLGTGGEIFVLDMGEPVKIVDLAKQMIRLSGLRPGEDIDIEFCGLRPGEKLYEELQHRDEDHSSTEHPKIMKFLSQPVDFSHIESVLTELRNIAEKEDTNELRRMLISAVPEYKPYV